MSTSITTGSYLANVAMIGGIKIDQQSKKFEGLIGGGDDADSASQLLSGFSGSASGSVIAALNHVYEEATTGQVSTSGDNTFTGANTFSGKLSASNGIAVVGNAAFDDGTFTTVVASGIIKTDDTTEATTTTDGSLQTDGGLSVAKSAVIGDDLDLLSNAAVFKVGSDQPFTLTHSNANNTLLATADHRLAFGDAGEYIYGDGTDLKIVSSNDIDVTGDVDIVGGLTSTQATVLAGTAGTTTIGSTTGVVIGAAGIVSVNNATEATSTTDGSLQTDGGLSVAKSAVVGDDLSLLSDSAILNFGAGEDVSLTHTNDVGIHLNAGMRLGFRDQGGEYIYSVEDGILGIVGAAEIDLTATAIDLNGTLDVSGDATFNSDVYVKDDKKLYFGDGEDASFEYDENGTDTLLYAGASLRISDDVKLEFGTGGDASFEYDEDGNDVLLYAGASMRFGDDIKLEFGAAGDASIEYDENGNDVLAVSGPGIMLTDSGNTNGVIVVGTAGFSTTTGPITAAAGLTGSGLMIYNNDADDDGNQFQLLAAHSGSVTVTGDLTVSGITTPGSLNLAGADLSVGSLSSSGGFVSFNASGSSVIWQDDAAANDYELTLGSGDKHISMLSSTDFFADVTASAGLALGSHLVLTSDAAVDIGTTSVGINDLHLGSGGVVNFDGGDVTMTHSANTLTVAGGTLAASAVTTSTIVASGIVKTDDTTEATSTTDGSLQTDGGLSVAKSAVIGDDLDLLSDGAIMNIGSTSKFTLTDQSANNAVMASANHRLAFGNAGEYIAGDGTDLKIVSSGDVDITGDTDVVGGISSTQATVLASSAGTTTIGSTVGSKAVVTAAGIVNVNNATEATTTGDGSLQTDGGLSVVKSAVIGDDLDLLSDGAIMNIGSTSKFTITDQSANNCVMASANHRLAFGNAGEYIAGDGTDLKIVSSGDVDITGDTTFNDGVTITGKLSASNHVTLASGKDLNFQGGGGPVIYDSEDSEYYRLEIQGGLLVLTAVGDGLTG